MTNLNRAFVGLDQVLSAFEARVDNYPPHNMIKYDDERYAIMIAVAGFGKDDISVMVEQKVLTIKGKRSTPKDEFEYIHRGVALRNFEKKFKLHEWFEVNEVKIENGMLIIDIKRVVPEEMKPRLFEIK